jgi:hypothetical protein
MPDITPEAWARARYDYEYTDRPTGDIARELGTSLNTLRDRARRWGWRLRHAPIPDEGPAALAPPHVVAPPRAPQLQPLPPPQLVSPSEPDALTPDRVPLAPLADNALLAAEPPPAADEPPPLPDDIPTVERLQSAVVAVLANIEAIVAKARTGRTHASENERAARALAALTRTLRELKAFQTSPQEPQADDTVDDIDEFRRALARKIDAFIATHGGGVRDGAEPQGT